MRYLLILLLFSAPVHGQYSVETDRFTGAVTHTVKADLAPPRDVRVAWFHVIHNGGDTAIMVTISANRWRYLNCQQMDWLVGGTPLATNQPIHDGRVTAGGVVEQMIVMVPLAAVAAMADARTVEFRVCRDEYRLPPETHRHMRQLIEATRTRT